MHFNGDKFRKIKANERRHTCRITREFNADFTNFAPLKLNGVRISLGYRSKKDERFARLFLACVRQNLVFEPIFDSVLDDK